MKSKVLLVCLVLAGMVLAGCGSGSKSSSTTTTTSAKQAVCASRSKLQQSVKALAEPSTLTSGKSGITAALDTVKQNLDDLASAAKSDVQPKVDAVKTAVDQLQTAVSTMSVGNLADGLQSVSDAIAKVGTTASSLFGALSAGCPN